MGPLTSRPRPPCPPLPCSRPANLGDNLGQGYNSRRANMAGAINGERVDSNDAYDLFFFLAQLVDIRRACVDCWPCPTRGHRHKRALPISPRLSEGLGGSEQPSIGLLTTLLGPCLGILAAYLCCLDRLEPAGRQLQPLGPIVERPRGWGRGPGVCKVWIVVESRVAAGNIACRALRPAFVFFFLLIREPQLAFVELPDSVLPLFQAHQSLSATSIPESCVLAGV